MTDLDYGNARLRVRASRWLDAEDYRILVESSGIDGLLGALAPRNYQAAVERVIGRYAGLRRLDEAVRLHLSAELSAVVSFYSGRVADRLQLYLQRWDIRNIRTILRELGQRSRLGAAAGMLVAAGTLDAAALDEVAAQRDASTAVDLLSVWGLPSPAVVRKLRAAVPRFAHTGDVAILDGALDEAFGALAVDAASEGDDVASLLRTEVDRLNLMAGVRLRRERDESRGSIAWSPIKGGRAPEHALRDLVELEDAEAAVSGVLRYLPTGWVPHLHGWAESGEAIDLEHRLDSEMASAAIERFRTGDPLGIDIPLGYIGQQEAEARNLRLIGRTIALELSREEAMRSLIGVP